MNIKEPSEHSSTQEIKKLRHKKSDRKIKSLFSKIHKIVKIVESTMTQKESAPVHEMKKLPKSSRRWNSRNTISHHISKNITITKILSHHKIHLQNTKIHRHVSNTKEHSDYRWTTSALFSDSLTHFPAFIVLIHLKRRYPILSSWYDTSDCISQYITAFDMIVFGGTERLQAYQDSNKIT